MEIPKFRLRTTITFELNEVKNYFNLKYNVSPALGLNTHIKGADIILLEEKEKRVIVEFHCSIKSLPDNEAGMDISSKNVALSFCKNFKTELISLHTKSTIPASDGALTSELFDLFKSSKFRKAWHFLNHPKDREKFLKSS